MQMGGLGCRQLRPLATPPGGDSDILSCHPNYRLSRRRTFAAQEHATYPGGADRATATGGIGASDNYSRGTLLTALHRLVTVA